MLRYKDFQSHSLSTENERVNVDEEDLSDHDYDEPFTFTQNTSIAKSTQVFRSHSMTKLDAMEQVNSKDEEIAAMLPKQRSSLLRSTSGPSLPPKPVIMGMLSSTKILSKHQTKLPMSLELTNGLYGRDQMTTFTQAERIEALYARKVVYAQLNIQRDTYKVPLSSTFSFAPVYTQGNKIKQAMNGYTFPSPGTLLRAKPRPDVVIALRTHIGTTLEDTVEVKDVLWILGEEKQGCITCIHAITGATKKIPVNTDMLLSTDPTQLFLPLSEIVTYSSLPVKVLMKPPTQLPDCVSNITTLQNTQVVEVIKTVENTSLICWRTVGVDALDIVFSMPEGVDLDMIAVSQTYEERKDLCQKVGKMLSRNKSGGLIEESLLAYQISRENKSSFDLQLAFLRVVENCHKSSQSICPPDVQLHLSSSTRNKAVGSSVQVENRIHMLEKECRFLSSDVEDCKKSVRAVSKTITTKVLPEIQELKKTSLQYLERLQEVQNSLAKVEERLTNHEERIQNEADYQNFQPNLFMQGQASLSTATPTDQSSAVTKNLQFLETLTTSQVLDLMQCMGLSKYAAIMRDEKITGSLLLQLTDSILEKDLHITTRFHRLKIMDLIKGQIDAFTLLTQNKSSHSS